MTSYKIDEVATRSGLTKRTLRYYEEIGLLPPPQRSSGGTRLYSEADMQFLERMLITKEVLGFSLQELQAYMQTSEQLDQHRLEYRSVENNKEDQMKVLQNILGTLDKQLHYLKEKSKKIHNVKHELETLQIRALARIAKLNDEEE
ncbi:MerR family transcriptional regulator [Aureibacillus halotolerans]|uniref:DNA-binding transcriptional MerR regulator n=1 Tax=Aureibacillus halotolerans TaxID=1508390 RepID=A0A4V3D4Q6_9BACI|nr:MerR family transcriptional regulator [Aureibacillus halotolerans]TDQ37177.1 DNA-binding transcriptional MerR regulator [Aureibacillus halotolerans]